MPLDLKKVITQIKSLESQDLQKDNQNRLESTYKLFQRAKENHKKLMNLLLETKSTQGASFYFATPEFDPSKNEDLDTLYTCNKSFSQPHITIATDGSQINPSAHEFTGASLINIGLVSIPYFNSGIPVLLSSEPTTYNSSEEINPVYPSENIQEEDLISYERTLKEIEGIVELAKKYVAYKIPVVALLDGTLIHWHIEKFSSAFTERFIKRFSDALHELKSLDIPIASFLSNSRSNDLINMLRIFNCPYEKVNCKKHCASIESGKLPCNPSPDYKPVLDRRLIEKHFNINNTEAGTRTILFKSNSNILNYYSDDLKVYFFYINTGTEVARVELPAYVAKNYKLLDLLHNAIALQCKVGFGYPVTLSEAHLMAVVNKNDRQVFYDLVKEHLLRRKQMPIRLSNKELKKRVSFV
ncbi:MAG: DNA double-strand break repair nuclease NurA [Candidatus Melainabacteria bacterium]|nr:DNA double-strand break repair nuclease NurA [Candidatus Melainabacteria bacterium]